VFGGGGGVQGWGGRVRVFHCLLPRTPAVMPSLPASEALSESSTPSCTIPLPPSAPQVEAYMGDGMLTPERAAALEALRDKMGLPKESADKIIKGFQNQKLIAGLQVGWWWCCACGGREWSRGGSEGIMPVEVGRRAKRLLCVVGTNAWQKIVLGICCFHHPCFHVSLSCSPIAGCQGTGPAQSGACARVEGCRCGGREPDVRRHASGAVQAGGGCAGGWVRGCVGVAYS
jgi:hypothetical protein